MGKPPLGRAPQCSKACKDGQAEPSPGPGDGRLGHRPTASLPLTRGRGPWGQQRACRGQIPTDSCISCSSTTERAPHAGPGPRGMRRWQDAAPGPAEDADSEPDQGAAGHAPPRWGSGPMSAEGPQGMAGGPAESQRANTGKCGRDGERDPAQGAARRNPASELDG